MTMAQHRIHRQYPADKHVFPNSACVECGRFQLDPLAHQQLFEHCGRVSIPIGQRNSMDNRTEVVIHYLYHAN